MDVTWSPGLILAVPDWDPTSPQTDASASFGEMLSFAVTLAAVLGLLWTGVKFIGRLWETSLGVRLLQTRTLNSLFPGANIHYVERLLGPPTLVSREDSKESVRRYRLPDCWVSIGVANNAAHWMSVTVTDSKFRFRTNQFTQGLVDLLLGHDSFDKVSEIGWFQHEEFDGPPGQKEQTFTELCDGPTAVRSQKMVVGYTNLGAGRLSLAGDLMSPTLIRDETTVNSLAVGKPFAELPDDVFLGWQEAQVVPPGRKIWPRMRRGRQ